MISNLTLLFCLCNARWLPQLVEELNDKIQADAPQTAHIALYGTTQRTLQGFIIIILQPSVPDPFRNALIRQLHTDEDVLDFVSLIPAPLLRLLDDVHSFTKYHT